MLNEEELEILWTELEKPEYADELAVRDYASIVSVLNYQNATPNPTPQPQRPKLITWGEFMKALSDVDGVQLYDHGALASDMKAALAANDRAMAQDLWRSIKTFLSPASIAAVNTAFQQTEADPHWKPTLSQPSIAHDLGLPAIALEDVQTAAHRFGGA
jgi:hypothetical protein